jgi:hypothetical protein
MKSGSSADIGSGGQSGDAHVLHARAGFQRRVGVGLQRHGAATPPAFVRSDQQRGVAVLYPVGQAVRGKPAEHHRMDRPNPGAGQHRDSCFRDHGQIDRDPVAAFHSQRLHRIRQAADLVVQFPIRHMAAGVGVIALPDDRGRVGTVGQMPIETRDRGIQDPVLEPLDRDITGEGGILDSGRERHPGDAFGFLCPIGVRVGCGLLAGFSVSIGVHVCCPSEIGPDLKELFLGRRIVCHGFFLASL